MRHGIIEFVWLRRARYEPGAAVFHDFGASALVRDNAKSTAQHRFDKCERQPFCPRGQNQRVMRFPDGFNVADKTGEIDILEGQASGKLAQSLAVVARAEKRDG